MAPAFDQSMTLTGTLLLYESWMTSLPDGHSFAFPEIPTDPSLDCARYFKRQSM
jgi:hypothetical protein